MKAIHNKDYSVVKTLKAGPSGLVFFCVWTGQGEEAMSANFSCLIENLECPRNGILTTKK